MPRLTPALCVARWKIRSNAAAPAAFFIDEAHHLGKVSGGRKFQDHLDVIKSLANTAETMHVLVGTYELQLLLNLSDQLSRRSRTFHFER